MKGYTFTEHEEDHASNPNGKANEQNALFLFHAYTSLIRTFSDLSDKFLKNAVTLNDM